MTGTFSRWLNVLWGGSGFLGLFVIGFIWLGLSYLEKVEHNGAELAAIRGSDNLARAFERHFSAGLDEADRILLAMRKSYLAHPDAFDFKPWLLSNNGASSPILLLGVIGPNGILKSTNAAANSAPPIDFSESEQFKVHVHSVGDRLYISSPVIGRTTGKPSLLITRRIENIDGSFGGVVTASLNIDYFTQLYNAVDLGSNGLVSITGTDGIVRITDHHNPSRLGLDLSNSDLLRHYRVNAIGDFATESGVRDNIPRLIAYRAIGNYPLIITVGLSKAEVFASAVAHSKMYNYVGAFLSLFILLIVAFNLRASISLTRMADQLKMKNIQFRTALANMSQGLSMFDASHKLIVANERYGELYGLDSELTKPGTSIRAILDYRVACGAAPDDPEKYINDRVGELAANKPYQITNKLSDGRFISVAHQPMDGGGWVTTHADITEQKLAEEKLDETKAFLDSIIENIPIAIIVKDAKTREFVLVNRAFEAMIGLRRDELLGRTLFDIYQAKDAELIDKTDNEYLLNSVGPNYKQFEVETPMRGLRIHATTRIVVRDNQGNPKYLVVAIEDVTDRRKSEQQIAFMAHHDALTGLANRVAVAQKIEEAAARQRRFGEPFSVLLLDLDRFKYVNDTLGHPAGDALLREVATRLKAFLRETDVLARLGGDEFAIIQTGEADQRQEASGLADRIIDIIAKPLDIEGTEVHISGSIGIALAPAHATDNDSLLKMADMALYSAKLAGRNGYRFFDPEMSVAASERQGLERDLRRAITQEEFELHYQPIIDTKTRKICGAEALIRWRHPTKGMIPPDQFIPLAEETGLIAQIGEWVLLTACIEAVSWPASVKVAVNLSPVQFRKSNLPDVVMYALAQSGLPPEQLELEITETALIESAADCLPALRQFKNLGIAVALDDFGTGYSSLSQLTMFPFDKIKIDKSCTQNLTKRTECAAIVSATLTLAQSLDIATTAEGVETVQQYQLLRMAGVTSLQGYLFKRPGPASEIDFDGVYTVPEVEDAA
jgi:diguanylate cyclase (GGDEF)-like protein/PAS domain S-box-containing protein